MSNTQIDMTGLDTIPDGMTYAEEALTGRQVLVYLNDRPAPQAPAVQLPASVAQPQRLPARPTRTSDPITTRILAGGAATSGVLATAAWAAPAIHALEGPAIAVAVAAGAAWLFKASSPNVHVTVNSTITGASATSSSDASSSSAAGWKPRACMGEHSTIN